jgi:hypothetical protein
MAVQGEEEDIWLDFSLGMDNFAEVTAVTTPVSDKRKIRVRVPPGKLIPIVFLPGIMGSNLRLTRERQELLKRTDNLAWGPDKKGDAFTRRTASAAARQMRLDPDAVEVDIYERKPAASTPPATQPSAPTSATTTCRMTWAMSASCW